MSFLTLFLGEEEARPWEELATQGTRGVPDGCWRDCGVCRSHETHLCVWRGGCIGVSRGRHLERPRIQDHLLGGLCVQSQLLQRLQCVRVCVCTCVSEWGFCISDRSEVAASGAHMARCQQLARLGSGGQTLDRVSVWAWLLKGSTLYTCLYFPLMDLHPDQPERVRPLVLSVFVWVLHIYVVYVHLCVVPAANRCSALLLLGPGGIELQEPHFWILDSPHTPQKPHKTCLKKLIATCLTIADALPWGWEIKYMATH